MSINEQRIAAFDEDLQGFSRSSLKDYR